ncbi:MAG TPA: TIM-barrel domain-containing protein, partial [Herpetosiphonaceae bacterium]
MTATAFGQLPGMEQAWTTLGAVQTLERDERGVRCDCGGPLCTVAVLAPNLVQVRMSPTGSFSPRRSWAVNRDDADWPGVPFELREQEDAIEIETQQMLVRIQRDPCRVTCFDRAGRPFAQDAPMGCGWRLGAVAGWKQIEEDEHFYGFGERTRLLDHRTEQLTNWTRDAVNYSSATDNMYIAIPFFIALRPQVSYGLFFNTTYRSRFDIGAERPGEWCMETHGAELDYYIIYGEPAAILRTYSELTGRMPLPPRWALGYHQCRWSYESEQIVRELAGEFRSRRIPCDVIHLDIDYMRGYRVFTWSPKRFSDPEKLVRDLAEDGFKTVTIIDPGVKYEPEADYEPFDQGLARDYFVRTADGTLFHGYVWPDRAVFPDVMRPEVREWWGDLHKSLTDIGVAGIWNDMNEPAIKDQPFGEPDGKHITMPLDAPQGPLDERATHAETRNLYGSMMSRATHEALSRLRNERSFVLSRSGYAGIQRWSASWMGDNRSAWSHLEISLPMLCNMGLSGVPFVGCDIGGFFGNATGELFARWMQLGVLYPFMRGHSELGTKRHEPWVFGERVEQICREYIELRYRLLPYIYALFWEAATTGAPILRPLLYHFPNDPRTYDLHDQVVLGPSLLAAPIYRPGVEYRAVYLPAGTWYDWWSGERYEGPTDILAHAPLERMPLYVRAGAVIPLGPVMQHTGERPLDELTVRVWPGSGEWTLYEDDGQSFDHQQGVWA